jgi:hypothetical protein
MDAASTHNQKHSELKDENEKHTRTAIVCTLDSSPEICEGLFWDLQNESIDLLPGSMRPTHKQIVMSLDGASSNTSNRLNERMNMIMQHTLGQTKDIGK